MLPWLDYTSLVNFGLFDYEWQGNDVYYEHFLLYKSLWNRHRDARWMLFGSTPRNYILLLFFASDYGGSDDAFFRGDFGHWPCLLAGLVDSIVWNPCANDQGTTIPTTTSRLSFHVTLRRIGEVSATNEICMDIVRQEKLPKEGVVLTITKFDLKLKS